MIPHTEIADELIHSMHIIRNQKLNHDTGGARRHIKGKIWEKILIDVANNVVEEKELNYTVNKKSITIGTVKRNPDLTIWNNDNDLIYIGSAKDYGDVTQLCPELITFLLARNLPNIRKCIYFRGHRGSQDNIINDYFNELNLQNTSIVYNFTPIKRYAKNETFILDLTREQIIHHIDEFNIFLSEIIE